jgi:hypothetical protein
MMHHDIFLRELSSPLPTIRFLDTNTISSLNTTNMEWEELNLYTPLKSWEYGIPWNFKISTQDTRSYYTLGLFDCLGLAIQYDDTIQIAHISDACYNNSSRSLFSRPYLYTLKKHLLNTLNSPMTQVYIVWWNIYSFGYQDKSKKKYLEWVSRLGDLIGEISDVTSIVLYWPSLQSELHGAYHNLHISLDSITVDRMSNPYTMVKNTPLFTSLPYTQIAWVI